MIDGECLTRHMKISYMCMNNFQLGTRISESNVTPSWYQININVIVISDL